MPSNYNADSNHKEYNFDVQKFDVQGIEQFLRSGKKEECRQVLEEFFAQVGEERLKSLMLRLYLTMDIYIIARTFTKELNISNDEFIKRFGTVEDISSKLVTTSSTFDYFLKMLEQCVSWRIAYSHDESNSIIKKAEEYILENFNREDLSLKVVADTVNLSPTYFSSIFKRHSGTSFVDYLTQVRLNKAKELLCCTSMQVSEIAYEVGFKDYRYFSQIFKKVVGVSPREFKLNSNKA